MSRPLALLLGLASYLLRPADRRLAASPTWPGAAWAAPPADAPSAS